MKDRRLQFVLAGARSLVRAFVRACVRAWARAIVCPSLFAPRSLAAKMKIARLARGYKRQLYVPNVGLAWRERADKSRACVRACVLRRTRRLIPPLIYVLIYVLPCVTRRGTYRYARRLYASPILSRAPNVNADKPHQCTVPSLSLSLSPSRECRNLN